MDFDNTVTPMVARQYRWLERVTSDEKPQAMGGLLLILVVLAHICLGLWLLKKPEQVITLAKPLKLMDVSLLVPPRPVVAPPAPAAVVEPPKLAPPKPVLVKPVEPKAVVKPKEPVIKEPIKKKTPLPKPVLQPKSEPAAKPIAPTSQAVQPAPATPKVVAPPAPKPQEKPTPITNVSELHCPEADYPSIATRRNWEGKGKLKLTIAADGLVEQVAVTESSGHDALDEAAMEAAKQCQFSKGTLGVTRFANKPFSFNLNN